MPLVLCCIAVLALAYGFSDYTGLFLWSAMPPIAICVAAAVAAACQRDNTKSNGRFDFAKLTSRLLAAGVIISIAWLTLFRLEVPTVVPLGQWLQRVHACALLGVSLYVFGPSKLKPVVFSSLVALFAFSAVLMIEAHPMPPIDTWYFQQAGANGLLHGQNPYVLAYRTPYNEADAAIFYGPGVLRNGLLMSYTYPPLNLLVQVPFSHFSVTFVIHCSRPSRSPL